MLLRIVIKTSQMQKKKTSQMHKKVKSQLLVSLVPKMLSIQRDRVRDRGSGERTLALSGQWVIA